MPRSNPNRFVVTADQADRRLDRVLRGLYPDVPLAAIMKALRTGGVRLNARKRDGAARLAQGDIVDVPWQDERPAPQVLPEKTGTRLKTLFRSDDLWCVEKPTGLLSQPDRKGGDSVITAAWSALSWTRADFRPALIHRLDRNVSGVMAIALNAPVLRTLSEQMREGRIRKLYRAVVRGTPPAHGTIDAPLYKDEARNTVRVDARGKEALTRYRTLRSGNEYSLVELELVTGRPHQARAHLASIGHPIVGDEKYGEAAQGQKRRNGRLFLHASELFFQESPELPQELKGLTVKSEIPKEFENFIT